MISLGIGPGMEYGQYADFGADIFRICSQLHKCLSRCLHEDTVKRLLVFSHHFPQFTRQGEDHMEIDGRQKFGPPFLKPSLCIIPMAFGARAILAGMI